MNKTFIRDQIAKMAEARDKELHSIYARQAKEEYDKWLDEKLANRVAYKALSKFIKNVEEAERLLEEDDVFEPLRFYIPQDYIDKIDQRWSVAEVSCNPYQTERWYRNRQFDNSRIKPIVDRYHKEVQKATDEFQRIEDIIANNTAHAAFKLLVTAGLALEEPVPLQKALASPEALKFDFKALGIDAKKLEV